MPHNTPLQMPSALELGTADEAKVLLICQEELAHELSSFPEFQQYLEDIDYYICSRAEFLEALRRSPSVTIRQSLWSVFGFRQTLAMITGRSFS